MDNMRPLLELPLATLAPLAAGYIGYRIAFAGRDGGHRAADVVFLSLVFALLGKLVMAGFGPWAIPGAIAAVLGTGIAAAAWRNWGADRGFAWLRRWSVLDHDGQPDVWRSMLARQNLDGPNRITVRLRNGKQFLCNDTRPFSRAPLGACLLGKDGSVAPYVTHIITPSTNGEWEETAPFDPEGGYDMTFVPASKIESVDVRRIC